MKKDIKTWYSDIAFLLSRGVTFLFGLFLANVYFIFKLRE